MMKPIKHNSQILIVGAGTWGCAISLSLARRGYKHITVLDSHDFPSEIAAGNDINKIMEEECPSDSDSDHDYYFNRISQLSGHAWRTDPIYSRFYHSTGFIMAAASDRLYKESVVPYAESHVGEVKLLDSTADWQTVAPEIFKGDFPGWRGAWRQQGAGWVFARGALEAAHDEAIRLGVNYCTGSPRGNVTSLVFSADNLDVQGAKTADGATHYADLTIVSAGAGSDALLDFKKQLRPTAWTLAHIQLTEEEAKAYKDMPVPYNVERGFFIEPNTSTYEMKICDEHPGYCNFVRDKEKGDIVRSVPFAKFQIPLESEERMRCLLRDTMPQLAERAFSFARICWDADTVDRLFLIDWHPQYRSLILACGASGHGVNPMPAIGRLVVDLMEGKMEGRLREGSRWRPEQAKDRNWLNAQGRHGAEERMMEFKNVRGWTNISEHMQN